MANDTSAIQETDTTEQRFAIVTPNPVTRFVLGSRSAADIGYSGITGTTVKHVFLQATSPGTSSSDASTATMEAPGQVLIHSSGGTLLQFAVGNAVVASQDSTYITGKNLVMIGAGPLVPTDPGLATFDPTNNPDSPRDVYPSSSLTATADRARKNMNDHFLEIFMPINAAFAAGSFLLGKTKEILSGVVGLVQLGTFGSNLAGGMLTHGKGDTHMFGENTSTISSANNVFAIADNTTAVASGRFTSVFAGLQASMTGGLAVGMTGLLAGVNGFVKAEMLSLVKIIIAARKGSVDVRGEQLSFGAHAPPFPQGKTKLIELHATDMISALAKKSPLAAASGITILPDGVRTTGKKHVTTASDRIAQVVGKFVMEMSTSGLILTKGLPSTIDAQFKQAEDIRLARIEAADVAYWATYQAMRASGAGGKAQRASNAAAALVKKASIAAAEAAFETATKAATAAKAAIAGLIIDDTGATLRGGLVEAVVKPTGITIDSKGMPITIQCSPTSSIKLTPAGVEIKGMPAVQQN